MPLTVLPGDVHAISIAVWHGTFGNVTMKTMIPMDSSGRLVLPKSIRQSLNAPHKAVSEAEVLGNRLELTLTEASPAKLRRKGRLLVVPRQGAATDAVKGVEDARRDRL